jgi:hypothetical protein
MPDPARSTLLPTRLSAAIGFLLLFGATPLSAQYADTAAVDQEEAAAKASEAEELAKQIQNPLATVVTLPFQVNFNEGVGEFDRRVANLNFQPVIPFPGEKWNLVSRSIIPYLSIPQGERQAETGFGDLTTTLFASPAKPGAVIWGVGPVLQLPTASNPDLLGTGKTSMGPSGVLFWGPGNWTLGAVAWQLWSVWGDSERESVSAFTAQWFLNYNLGKGWVLGTAPIITCDWKADSGEQCTIPWGGQISKILRFGSRPVNLLAGYYYNSEHPESGADSQVRVQINLLYPQAPK